jgi:hypothetical protein
MEDKEEAAGSAECVVCKCQGEIVPCPFDLIVFWKTTPTVLCQACAALRLGWGKETIEAMCPREPGL